MKRIVLILILLLTICSGSAAGETENTETVSKQAESVPITEKTVPEPAYSYEDLDLLARVIYAEAGASWIDEEVKWMVGAVVLNRVKSEGFPDTIREVIYQTEPTVQYACILDGNIDKTPTDLCYEIAADLLENGHTVPSDVVYQAEFKQGKIYMEIDGMYFCHMEEE